MPSACRRRRTDARLRRGRQRVARCDAEISPERGYYYHPSRHSAGKPIVAGWACQFVAQLGFARESWTAPVDVRGRAAPPVRPRRQRGRHRADQGFAESSRRRRGPASVRLRRGLRPRQGAASSGGEPVPDPRPLARRASLLRRPRPLRLWWHGREGRTPDLDLIWRSYVRRFDLEHTFRFLKQSMGWTTPRVRYPEQADRWSWLVVAAYTQLRLARTCVADLRLPWERRYDAGRLTPIRVHRAVSALLAHLGTPAKPPKPCGRSPGRPKGRLSGKAKRYPAFKKSA